ncbi:hypothetical protein [Halosimplex pelagicum]|uniref:hypothetical protein n=1 Tax=Halosimplex pelagicum TaxID=869886 RepID=UPI001FE25604|nr:hypothetical protein [Halosimplex pelagicum]
MLEVHRTHRAKIHNHSQVAESLDRHGWSASKLWNVANYHSREVWEETGEIPDHEALKDELKTHPKYKGRPCLDAELQAVESLCLDQG